MRIQIYYHGKCNDGRAALYAIEHLVKYSSIAPDAVSAGIPYEEIITSIPYFHGDEITLDEKCDWIMFLDCVPDESTMDIILQGSTKYKVLIVDHHDTALRTFTNKYKDVVIPDNVFINIDMSKSAALLTWSMKDFEVVHKYRTDVDCNERLFTNLSRECREHLTDEEIPLFFNLVSMRDIWSHKNPVQKSEADGLHSALISYSFSERKFDEMDLMLDQNLTLLTTTATLSLVKEGELMNMVHEDIAYDLIKSGHEETIINQEGVEIKALFTFGSTNVSNPGAIYYNNGPEPRIFINVRINYPHSVSIGVRSNTQVLSNKFCESLVERGIARNGGGHKQAAGADIALTDRMTVKGIVEMLKVSISEYNLINKE